MLFLHCRLALDANSSADGAVCCRALRLRAAHGLHTLDARLQMRTRATRVDTDSESAPRSQRTTRLHRRAANSQNSMWLSRFPACGFGGELSTRTRLAVCCPQALITRTCLKAVEAHASVVVLLHLHHRTLAVGGEKHLDWTLKACCPGLINVGLGSLPSLNQ